MSKEKLIEWRCLNYGICLSSDARTVLPLPVGAPFRCPDCGGEEGIEIKPPPPFRLKPLIIGFSSIALLGLIIVLLKPGERIIKEPHPEPKPIAPLRIPTEGTVIVDERTGLPKKVLARPQSKIQLGDENPVADGEQPVQGKSGPTKKLRDFERLFVFKEEANRLQVGESDKSPPSGWMKREDAIDWPHSLVVEFTNPDNRKQVLFFGEKEQVARILDDWPTGRPEVEGYYGRVKEIAGGAPTPDEKDFPIMCVEPEAKIGELYLLPVLTGEIRDVDGNPTTILKVTAAGRKRGATDVKGIVSNSAPQKIQVPTEVPVDILLVMDMTGSMQPWVDGLLKVMSGIAARIGTFNTKPDLVRMGFWGYQDDPSLTGIQFLTKNYTPELIPPGQFAQILSGRKVNKVTDDSYPEDVFSGVKDGIEKTNWRPGSQKILILVGDAPGHPSTDKGGKDDATGATGMGAPQLRELATAANVQIVAVQIKDFSNPTYERWHHSTTDQFTMLSRNGNRPPAIVTISSREPSPFEKNLNEIVNELIAQHSLKGDAPKAPSQEPKGEGTKIAEGLLAAAKVEQVSVVKNQKGEVVVPRDFTGWVVDRDLLNPSVVSLEPKLLVNKNELGTLEQTVSDILKQARQGAIVGGSFFDRVMSTVAETASGQKMDKKTLASSVPKFIQGLPYKSDLMKKPAEWWDSRTSEQQNEFIRGLEAKLAYYRNLNENPKMWMPLNIGDDLSLHVVKLPLSQLP